MTSQNQNLIHSFNAAVMEDKAYRWLFGREVNEGIRTVLRWIILLDHKYGKVPTMELREAVSAVTGVGLSVARTYMHDAEERGYATSKTGELGNEMLWRLHPEWKRKWLKVQDLQLLICDVVRRQLAEPDNPHAGAGLVPAEVYYNVIADERLQPEDIAGARERRRTSKSNKMKPDKETDYETATCPNGFGGAGSEHRADLQCRSR